MSVNLPVRPRMISAHVQHRVAIVASEYNAEFVQGLVNNASRELYAIQSSVALELFSAPGAFEIPFIAKLVAAKKKHEVIIALGVILRGQTQHADLVATAVTHGLQQVALESGIPVIHEVLLLDDEKQAKERCIEQEKNRGVEAARSALQMAKIVADLQNK
ncbi:MAG: 6,7-dimethyl-8-ribityllumazine synthase [Chthoniobacterales bacterium]